MRGVVALAAVIISGLSVRGLAGEPPETVMITLHAKPGAEADLARVIAQHWDTARRLNLVLKAPHMTLRGTEKEGGTYFVDIFTWRSAEIPDSAPPPILAIWAEMNRLVESRGGRHGLDIAQVSPVGR